MSRSSKNGAKLTNFPLSSREQWGRELKKSIALSHESLWKTTVITLQLLEQDQRCRRLMRQFTSLGLTAGRIVRCPPEVVALET